MVKRVDQTNAQGDEVRLPPGVVLKPAISADDLKADTEYDPKGADEFVALINALRNEHTRSITL